MTHRIAVGNVHIAAHGSMCFSLTSSVTDVMLSLAKLESTLPTYSESIPNNGLSSSLNDPCVVSDLSARLKTVPDVCIRCVRTSGPTARSTQKRNQEDQGKWWEWAGEGGGEK